MVPGHDARHGAEGVARPEPRVRGRDGDLRHCCAVGGVTEVDDPRNARGERVLRDDDVVLVGVVVDDAAAQVAEDRRDALLVSGEDLLEAAAPGGRGIDGVQPRLDGRRRVEQGPGIVGVGRGPALEAEERAVEPAEDLPELLEQCGRPPAQLGEEAAGDEAQEPRLPLGPLEGRPDRILFGARRRLEERAEAGVDVERVPDEVALEGDAPGVEARRVDPQQQRRVRRPPDGDPGVRLEVPREHLHRLDVEAERAAGELLDGASGGGGRHRSNLPKSIAAVLLVALRGGSRRCAAHGQGRGVHARPAPGDPTLHGRRARGESAASAG